MNTKLTKHQRELAAEILGTLQALAHRAYERIPVPDDAGNVEDHPLLVRIKLIERGIDRLRDEVYNEEY